MYVSVYVCVLVSEYVCVYTYNIVCVCGHPDQSFYFSPAYNACAWNRFI